jgi:hypothetical protein
MMENRSIAAWLRPLAGLFALAGVLALGACGGGSGAPNNPYDPGTPTPAALQVLPAVSTAYQGTPTTLTITGGVPPYRAFSSDATALPVTQAVADDSVLLLPNAVSADTPVNISIQDSAATTVVAQVTVKPAPLLPNLITIVANTDCPVGTVLPGNMCSGGTGTASVVVTSPTGAGVPGRQVRFDVVAGDFAMQSANPAQPLVQTLTVVTDQNGRALVGIAVAITAPTQIGIIRATDVTTGNQVTGQFTIQQVTNGSAILSVIPAGLTTITGSLKGSCSLGVRVIHYIFGGTPPYRVFPSFPEAVVLFGDLTIPNSVGVQVNTNGGSFITVTRGLCFEAMEYAISDATGRTIPSANSPTLSNVEGTTEPTPPTPAPALAVTPTSTTAASCVGKTFSFFASGGTPPYSALITPQIGAIITVVREADGATFSVSGIPAGAQAYTLTVYDQTNPQKTATASINCS